MLHVSLIQLSTSAGNETSRRRWQLRRGVQWRPICDCISNELSELRNPKNNGLGVFGTRSAIIPKHGVEHATSTSPSHGYRGGGMAMQDYGLGLRVGLKDLPTLRTRIHIKF